MTDIVPDGSVNIAWRFIDYKKELDGLLARDEPQMMESAWITLCDIHPQTRSEQYTGAHILCAIYFSAEARGDARTCAKLREFYDLIAKNYGLENEIVKIEKAREDAKKRASAAGQDPYPSAGAGSSTAKPLAQRDIKQVV